MEPTELNREEPLCDLDETLELVRHTIEDFSEEIPAQIVHGEPDGKLLKCQKNWFQQVIDVLQIVQQHIVFRGNIIPTEITNFLSFYISQTFKDQGRTTCEDISRANIVLELSKKILNGFKKE